MGMPKYEVKLSFPKMVLFFHLNKSGNHFYQQRNWLSKVWYIAITERPMATKNAYRKF